MTVPPVLHRPAVRRQSRLNSTEELGWTRFLELAEALPHWRHDATADLKPVLSLVPSDCTIHLTLEGHSSATVIAEGPSYVLALTARRGFVSALVAAADPEHASTVLRTVLPASRPTAPDEVPLSLWRLTAHGAEAMHRQIHAPDWPSVAANYSTEVTAALADLMSLRDVAGTARLMVLSGEPGTGKTSAVRALMREWRPWCASHLVIDPERLFDSAAYLVDVMTSPVVADQIANLTDVRERTAQWNLVICEDADAFLRTRGRATQVRESVGC